MTYPTQMKLLIGGLLLLFIFGRYGCYYADQAWDAHRRPWAYATDKPLLVGQWRGTCIDPDGITHTIDLEIFAPMTDEERMDRVNRRPKRKRSRVSATAFDGMALISTPAWRDSFELWGGLDAADGHTLHWQWRPTTGTHPAGFVINNLKGEWRTDELDLVAEFAWFRPDGSSHYDSANPKHEQNARMLLRRVQ